MRGPACIRRGPPWLNWDLIPFISPCLGQWCNSPLIALDYVLSLFAYEGTLRSCYWLVNISTGNLWEIHGWQSPAQVLSMISCPKRTERHTRLHARLRKAKDSRDWFSPPCTQTHGSAFLKTGAPAAQFSGPSRFSSLLLPLPHRNSQLPLPQVYLHPARPHTTHQLLLVPPGLAEASRRV